MGARLAAERGSGSDEQIWQIKKPPGRAAFSTTRTAMNFFEYIANLAPEGETALFVRQTPIKHKGELQFHADGAIKATWPAFMPDHKRKDGEAWYGNTASFIVDRFKDKPSAKIGRAHV